MLCQGSRGRCDAAAAAAGGDDGVDHVDDVDAVAFACQATSFA